jgi:hypothetical protein
VASGTPIFPEWQKAKWQNPFPGRLRRYCKNQWLRGQKALSASNAKAACLKLHEFVDCIVVAPRVKPADPIHYEVRRRLTALMQPSGQSVGRSVGAQRRQTAYPLRI